MCVCASQCYMRISLCRAIAYVWCAPSSSQMIVDFSLAALFLHYFYLYSVSCIAAGLLRIAEQFIFEKSEEKTITNITNASESESKSERPNVCVVCVYRACTYTFGLESCANLHNVFQTILESKKKREMKKDVKIIIRIAIRMHVVRNLLMLVYFSHLVFTIFLSNRFNITHFIHNRWHG